MRTARAELVVNAKTGETPKNRYAVEVEIYGDYIFVFPRTIVIAPTPEIQAMMAESEEGKAIVLARKMPSTIRVLSDVDDSIATLTKLDEYIRILMGKTIENEPSELEAKNIVGMLGTVIEKLADIQGDLTMGVKE